MSGTSKQRAIRRKARDKRLKSNLKKALKGQPTKAFTKLNCYNVTDKSIFVEGLQKAGLELVPRPFSSENAPNQLIIVLQSQHDAHQVVEALHGRKLKGKTMRIIVIKNGTQVGNVKGKVPKVKHIRRCVLDAFCGREFKEEDLAREQSEFAAALQEVCRKIRASKKATKKQKAMKDLPKEEGEAVAMEIFDSESDISKGLGEEIYKQEVGEERAEMPDDSFRPETSARQQLKAAETQSDLRGERSQIQDTAHEGERSYGSGMIMSTRSSTPEDMLSALLASLG